MEETIKCLSIRQPYASWLCNPEQFIQVGIEPKNIENRDWSTRFRGDFLIHASSTFEKNALNYWHEVFPALETAVSFDAARYPKGVLLGRATLVNVVGKSSSKWFCGDYGFVFSEARLLPSPLPYKGQLGFFNVPLSILTEQTASNTKILAPLMSSGPIVPSSKKQQVDFLTVNDRMRQRLCIYCGLVTVFYPSRPCEPCKREGRG